MEKKIPIVGLELTSSAVPAYVPNQLDYKTCLTLDLASLMIHAHGNTSAGAKCVEKKRSFRHCFPHDKLPAFSHLNTSQSITYVRLISQENSTNLNKELSKSISDHHLSISNK